METPGEQTFRDRNRALQELARELNLVRQHNLQFKEKDPQDKRLMFAEMHAPRAAHATAAACVNFFSL